MDYISVNVDGASKAAMQVLQAKLVPYLVGSPGIGKSAVHKALCTKFNLMPIDERITTTEPTDWKGLVGYSKVNPKKATYLPFDNIPLADDPIPTNPKTGKPYAGWLLFLDELPSGAQATIAAAYKLVLDREIGAEKVHPKCLIMAAGNLVSDGAIVNDIGTAMQSRMTTLVMQTDPKEVQEYAAENKWDTRVTAFLGFKPDLVHNFDPDHEDLTFPCPRTWEFLSRIIKNIPEIDYSQLPLLAGTVGMGAANEFIAFVECFGKLPTLEQIIRAPKDIIIPDDPGVHWAATSIISENIDETNAEPLIDFLLRLEIDMQMITIRAAKKRNPEIIKIQAVRDWLRANYKEFEDSV